MRFEQMTESQDADAVGDALGAADACEVAVKAGLKQGFFNAQIRQAKPLLWAMNTQHHCQIKRRTSRLGYRCVRGDQRQQLALRHHLLHLIEQSLLARAPQVEIKAKVGLFHAINNCNLRASDPTGWGRVLNMILNGLYQTPKSGFYTAGVASSKLVSSTHTCTMHLK